MVARRRLGNQCGGVAVELGGGEMEYKRLGLTGLDLTKLDSAGLDWVRLG